MRLDSPTRDNVNSTFSYPSLPHKCVLLFIIASRTSAYSAIMGRTVPSFRLVLATENQNGSPSEIL